MSNTCPQCGSETSDHAAFCPQCGTTLASGPTTPPTFTSPPPPSSTQPSTEYRPAPSAGTTSAKSTYNFNAARLSQTDRITGGASVVLFISLFLPWFGAYGFTIDGLSDHGYLYIVMLIVVGILVYLGARAGAGKLQINNSVAHNPLMLVASTVNVVFVLLAFLFKPAGTSWQYGAFLAVIAAIVAAAPIAVPAIRSRQSARR